MSDDDDWDFAGADDAKMTIRAAIRYLLKGATGGAHGDIVAGDHCDRSPGLWPVEPFGRRHADSPSTTFPLDT